MTYSSQQQKQDDDDLDGVLSSLFHKPAAPPHTPAPSSPKPKRQKRRNYWVYIAGILVIAAGVGVFIARDRIITDNSPSPFNQELKTAAAFPLYFPTALPNGYILATDSIEELDDPKVITYKISNGQNHTITVSIQKAVPDVNPAERLGEGTDSRKVETKLGTATIYTPSEGITAAILPVGQSWIFVNMAKGLITDQELDKLLQNFQQG